MRLNHILIVAGPNGAGKTSFAKRFLPGQMQAYDYSNADEIAQKLRALPIPANQVDLRAGRFMLAQINRSMALSRDVMIETTLSGQSWARHLPGWRANGYTATLYYLKLADTDTAVARVRQRVAQGGHDIPDEVIRRRFHRSLRNLNMTYKVLADEWYVFESLDGMEPRLVEAWR